MGNLASISAKIPIEWMDAIAAKGKPSAVVRLALAQYLGVEEAVYRDGIPTENPLRSEMDTIKARLSEVEKYISENPVYRESTPKTKRTTPPPPMPTPQTGAMRTGELFLALQARGYTRSSSSLLKALNKAIASGVVPDELAAFGVSCDFVLKRSAKPLAGNVKWLFLD